MPAPITQTSVVTCSRSGARSGTVKVSCQMEWVLGMSGVRGFAGFAGNAVFAHGASRKAHSR